MCKNRPVVEGDWFTKRVGYIHRVGEGGGGGDWRAKREGTSSTSNNDNLSHYEPVVKPTASEPVNPWHYEPALCEISVKPAY